MILNMVVERWLVFKISKYSHEKLRLVFKMFKYDYETLWLVFKTMYDKNPETRRKIEKNREPNMVL